jgi:hypothetical protein
MTINQVFLLLVFEMVVFGALIVPIPYTIKRKLFTFVSESPLVAKLQYGIKVPHPLTVESNHPNMCIDHFHLHPDIVHRQLQSRLPRAA